MGSTTYVDIEHLAQAFHAIADRKRLEIVRLLTDGEKCVCELIEIVGVKQSLLSFHLKILREADLVKSRRLGKWMYYSLNYATIDVMREIIGTVADGRQHQESCCCESLCCPADRESLENPRNTP